MILMPALRQNSLVSSSQEGFSLLTQKAYLTLIGLESNVGLAQIAETVLNLSGYPTNRCSAQNR
jgi:hypothetical protein